MARRRNRKSHARGRHVRARQRAEAEKRERLERRWYNRIDFTPEHADLVVQDSGAVEPFHRWLPYRQGYSPRLARLFLEQASPATGPLLDPCSGSGTAVIEWARHNRNALGIEALPCLAFLTQVRLHSGTPRAEPSPALLASEKPDRAWQAAQTPQEKAAVLMAAARTVKGDGRPRKDTPFATLVALSWRLLSEDLARPLPACAHACCGDARSLPLPEASLGGILTSPPYLSRYDYPRVVKPMRELFGTPHTREAQIRAHHRAPQRPWQHPLHPAAAEAQERLRAAGRAREAGVVRSYFEDLYQLLAAGARALQPGAPLTLVLGGALFVGVYVPSDLIAADLLEELGLEIEEMLGVRTLGPPKALGGLDAVPPRETILSARKPT